MTVKFFTRAEWKDGSLRERMISEGLPETLKLYHAKDGRHQRQEFECSSELAMALLRAGAPLEFTVWSDETLEYRRGAF